ncbi:MAG: type III sulfide quinone reductase, selenoprotein subtype [Polyangiales bacterium]
MKRLLVLGAGTAGTILVNRVQRVLPPDWEIVVVDPTEVHLYQPGLLFIPFGAHDEAADVRLRASTLRPGIRWIDAEVEVVEPNARTVRLRDGQTLAYDLLVIASGSRVRHDLVDGLLGHDEKQDVFDFYTLGGAQALRHALAKFRGGRLVVNVVEMPIKCPVAPLEFAFLADAFFTERGIRKDVEIVFATPLDGAFTRPFAAKALAHLLAEKNIEVEREFACSEIARDEKELRSYDERKIPYDLLVTIPTHSGAAFIERSGMGNELAFVPTDPRTLAAKEHANVFVIGDATDVPTSKAGSVAHFEAELLAENLVRAMYGEAPLPTFDGRANCFIETGHEKAMLIDFDYDHEPLPGWLGPIPLMRESRMAHLGKLAFRSLYWNALLPGRPLPIPRRHTGDAPTAPVF